jgi:hypothetical protein
MESCAMYDHDCHIAVIGPFLVEALPPSPAQQPPQRR